MVSSTDEGISKIRNCMMFLKRKIAQGPLTLCFLDRHYSFLNDIPRFDSDTMIIDGKQTHYGVNRYQYYDLPLSRTARSTYIQIGLGETKEILQYEQLEMSTNVVTAIFFFFALLGTFASWFC